MKITNRRREVKFVDIDPGDSFIRADGTACMKIETINFGSGSPINAVALSDGKPLSFPLTARITEAIGEVIIS